MILKIQCGLKGNAVGGYVRAVGVLSVLISMGLAVTGGMLPELIDRAHAERRPEMPDVSQSVDLTPEERDYLAKLGPLTVAPDPDWIPYEHVDQHGRFTGIAADLLDLLAKRLGIQFTYVLPKDWDEAVVWSRTGQVLILPFLNQTPAREEWLVFTEPLFIDPNVFITREEHPFIYDATELTGKTIVLPRGTSMEERIRRDFPNLKILNVATENEVFQAISHRQADMTLRSLTIAAYTIRKEGLFNLKIAGQAPDRYVNRLRIGVLHREPRLRDILNKGIATITPGEREDIINNHVNITVVKPIDYGFILRIAGGLAALIALSFYWTWRLRKINAALAESERSKSVLLANLPGMAYRCRYEPQWTMEFVSEGCLQLTGYPTEDLLHNRFLAYRDVIAPEDRERIWQTCEQALSSGQSFELEYRIITADQHEKWVFEKGIFIHDDKNNVQAIEGLIIDITDRKRAEEELYRVSIQDHLTGLYNRRFVFAQLNTVIAEFQRAGRSFSISIIDLDFFKKINDTYGHPAGDFILREFAGLLAANFRPYDLVGRYGGEEFLVATMNIDLCQTEIMLARLRDRIKNCIFDYEGVSLTLTFSAGVANVNELAAEATIEKMIHIADDRLYLAKAQGRDRIIIESPPMMDIREGEK